MPKKWALAELFISLLAIMFVWWPTSKYCTGRPAGLDCESWMIFAVNFYAPLGLLGVICSIWSLVTRSLVPQYILFAGFVFVLMLYALLSATLG